MTPYSRRFRRPAIAGAALSAACLAAAGCGATSGGSSAGGGSGSKTVTIYSADGLHDGSPNWDQTVFSEFTKKTGIKVNYVEGGSGVVVTKLEAQKSSPQADVLVTLPPFIQKAAADGDLAPYRPAGSNQIPASNKAPDGTWEAMVNNYACWIYDAKQLSTPPATWQDLLKPQFKGKLQYSTPGEAGDGTAVLIEVLHMFGGNPAKAFGFLKKLQANNVGPSSSTGDLTAKVNSGNLLVSNGDVQMNLQQKATEDANIKMFFPADSTGTRSTFAIPYAVGLVKNGPDEANGKKLISFLLSKQAQQKVSSIAVGYPARSDIHPGDANYARLQAALRGVHVWTPDWKALLPQLNQLISQWHTVTGS